MLVTIQVEKICSDIVDKQCSCDSQHARDSLGNQTFSPICERPLDPLLQIWTTASFVPEIFQSSRLILPILGNHSVEKVGSAPHQNGVQRRNQLEFIVIQKSQMCGSVISITLCLGGVFARLAFPSANHLSPSTTNTQIFATVTPDLCSSLLSQSIHTLAVQRPIFILQKKKYFQLGILLMEFLYS